MLNKICAFTTTFGQIGGLLIEETPDVYVLENSIMLKMEMRKRSAEDPGSVFVTGGLLQTLVKDPEKIFERFELKKSFVILEGELDPSVLNQYEHIVKTIRGNIAGIDIVSGANANSILKSIKGGVN